MRANLDFGRRLVPPAQRRIRLDGHVATHDDTFHLTNIDVAGSRLAVPREDLAVNGGGHPAPVPRSRPG